MVDYAELTDHELIVLLQKEDRIAFRELYNRYVKQLHFFILRTSKSPALAEDIVHDVFLKIWENRSQIRTDHAFKSYVFTIARNQLLNLLKRVKNESYILDEIMKHTVPAVNTTELQLNFNESNSIIQEAIDKLPPQSKAIFNRCKIEGKSYKQVAEEMGITEGTVNTQMVRALKSIKKYILLRGTLSLILMYILKS